MFYWDCLNLDLNETVRPEFDKKSNKTRKNPITGVKKICIFIKYFRQNSYLVLVLFKFLL